MCISSVREDYDSEGLLKLDRAASFCPVIMCIVPSMPHWLSAVPARLQFWQFGFATRSSSLPLGEVATFQADLRLSTCFSALWVQ
jgi:hypothetical protein